MANVQKEFAEFNIEIRLNRFGHSQTLRDKRNIIRTRLCERLPGVFEEYGEECPKFVFRDQGSYELGTGVIPLHGEFDIDQGIYFYTDIETYPDPLTLKKRVYEALEGHTDNVCIRNSCITVTYKDDGDGPFHVDMAVYLHANSTADEVALLAKGKETTPRDKREWQPSDQEGLTETLYAKFVSNDRSQWRRCVRYMKRWRAVNFSSVGNSAPIGIALTIAAYKYLYPQYSDRTAWVPNDLAALRTVVLRHARRVSVRHQHGHMGNLSPLGCQAACCARIRPALENDRQADGGFRS